MKQDTTPGNSLSGESKDTHSKTELQRFYELLHAKPLTCTQACTALGIPQKHLTWLKRRLEKAGMLAEINQCYCPITGRLAALITTDSAIIAKIPTQTSLFP